MAGWEQILLGVGALLLAFFFWPGIQATMEKSRQAENRDWPGLLVPLLVVVVFVVFLLVVASS